MFRFFAVLSLLLVLSACGGGGAGQDTDSREDRNYSVRVDKSELVLDVAFDRSLTTESVIVEFVGDGLVVGSPPDSDDLSLLDVAIQLQAPGVAEVSFSIRGTRLGTLDSVILPVRILTGNQNGEEAAYTDMYVKLQQQEGLESEFVDYGYLAATWGSSVAPLELQISTVEASWQATSNLPGIVLEPSSGVGPGVLMIGADFSLLPVTADSVEITIEASNGSVTTQHVELRLLPPSVETVSSIELAAAGYTPGDAQFFTVAVTADGEPLNLPWSLTAPPWATAERASGTTGVDAVTLGINSAGLPGADVELVGTVLLSVEVLGEPLVKEIPIRLQYQRFRIEASRNAFAFSDYGTALTHTGEFRTNVPPDAELTVLADADWLIIDETQPERVSFHLNTGALATGFHLAEIAVTPAVGSAMAEIVRVGYYKADVSPAEGEIAAAVAGGVGHAVADKLGPWVYIRPDSPQFALRKLNLVTGAVEATIEVDTLEAPGSMVVSDDGSTLFVYSYDSTNAVGQLVVVDLETFSLADILRFDASPAYLHYARVDGKPLLFMDGNIYDPSDGSLLEYAFGGSRVAMLLEEDIAASASTWGSVLSFHAINFDWLSSSVTSERLYTIPTGTMVDSFHLNQNRSTLALLSGSTENDARISLYEFNYPALAHPPMLLGEIDANLTDGHKLILASDNRLAVLGYNYVPGTHYDPTITTYDENQVLKNAYTVGYSVTAFDLSPDEKHFYFVQSGSLFLYPL
jgi:hypothetical protein